MTCRAVVLALGGGSWARLGSDGAWVPLLAFVRLTTRPELFAAPLRVDEAMNQVSEWLAAPGAVTIVRVFAANSVGVPSTRSSSSALVMFASLAEANTSPGASPTTSPA